MSKNALAPKKSTNLTRGSSKTRRKSLLTSARQNKENISDIANREPQDLNDEYGPNLKEPESYDVCETYLDELHRLFEVYCSFGEPGNFNTLKSAKFMKLMKDCHVLETKNGSIGLEAQEIDLIFCSVLQGIDPFNGHSRKKAN